MDLTNEQLSAAAVGVVVIIIAVSNYLRGLKAPNPPLNATLAAIGVAFGGKEQSERLIVVLTRCAVALEALADKRSEEMDQMHRALLERLDAQERREEQEEQRPRRQPPRRR